MQCKSALSSYPSPRWFFFCYCNNFYFGATQLLLLLLFLMNCDALHTCLYSPHGMTHVRPIFAILCTTHVDISAPMQFILSSGGGIVGKTALWLTAGHSNPLSLRWGIITYHEEQRHGKVFANFHYVVRMNRISVYLLLLYQIHSTLDLRQTTISLASRE